ncbi:MAG: hypothetical protein ACLFSX_04740, partial [Candidatus Acetothermia bacterium]
TPEEPDVEPVELEITMTNNKSSDVDLDEISLTITDDAGDPVVDDEQLDTNVTVEAGDSATETYEFTPEEEGSYTAEVTGNGYSGSFDFEIGTVVTDKPNPYWGDDGGRAESGILPAPVDGDETPFLELANEDGDSVHTYVTDITLRVFDLSGKQLAEIESGWDDLSELENMENGLYLYTVEYEVDTEDETQSKKSPVMKFVVKK